MKAKIFILSLLVTILNTSLSAQEKAPAEKYGNTLNAGIGIGYYGYGPGNAPLLHANYEFDVARNFTLAPFISFGTYQSNYYWGDQHYPFRYYSYRQTIIPVGVKGTYYFDQLLNANPKWDFYLAASLGFAFRKTTWENGYYGDTYFQNSSSGLYLDGHIGTEYHLNPKAGLFLDLSTGFSSFGMAFHF